MNWKASFFLSFLFLLVARSSVVGVYPQEPFFYVNPGLILERGGRVIGSDYLYLLKPQIAIVVEIIKTEDAVSSPSEEDLYHEIVKIFRKAQIKVDSSDSAFHLPFFHLLVMLHAVLDKEVIIICQGRLFENVTNDRLKLEKGTVFQAITWDSQRLKISISKEFPEQLKETVREIATSFADRFSFFEKQKERQKT